MLPDCIALGCDIVVCYVTCQSWQLYALRDSHHGLRPHRPLLLNNHLYNSQLDNFWSDRFSVHLGNKQGWSWKPECFGFLPELFTFIPGGNKYIPSMQNPREQMQFPTAQTTTPEKTLKLPTHGQQNPFLIALIKMAGGTFAQVAKWDIPGSYLYLNHSPIIFYLFRSKWN